MSLPTSGWQELEEMLARAGSTPQAEAAKKLITNRARVLNDVCNPARKSQPGIMKVPIDYSGYVENGMKECAWRLLGGGGRFPANGTERQAWVGMASVISARLQVTEDACPGRAPDMSPAAGKALTSALQGMTAVPVTCGCFQGLFSAELPTTGWEDVQAKLGNAPPGPRTEAARKLISNRGRVLNDVCNPARRTQPGITTVVPAYHSCYVESGMKECARILLGGGGRSPVNSQEAEAWAGMATVISSRLQTSEEQCPGRPADMSPEAGDALRSVLGHSPFTKVPAFCVVQ